MFSSLYKRMFSNIFCAYLQPEKLHNSSNFEGQPSFLLCFALYPILFAHNNFRVTRLPYTQSASYFLLVQYDLHTGVEM